MNLQRISSKLLLIFIISSEMLAKYLFINMSTMTKAIRGYSTKIKNILSTKGKYLLQFDGGSRGNPGLGGSGAVLYIKNSSEEIQELWSTAAFIGASGVTNNVAEYCGLLEGLKQAVQMEVKYLEIEGDSQLVINQLRGEYKVKNKRLLTLYDTAKDLMKQIPYIKLNHIPRELNKRADQLSNAAMDLGEQESIQPAEFSSLILSTIDNTFQTESPDTIDPQPSTYAEAAEEPEPEPIQNHLHSSSSDLDYYFRPTHKIILIILIKSKSRKHPNPLAVISDKIVCGPEHQDDSDHTSSSSIIIDFLSSEISIERPIGPQEGEPISHEFRINSAVKEFLVENKFAGKLLHTYTLWNTTTFTTTSTTTSTSSEHYPHYGNSSVNYCVVELQHVRRAVKKIETLNAQLAEMTMSLSHTQPHLGNGAGLGIDTGMVGKKAQSRRRPLSMSPNSILRMGVSRLHSVCTI